MTENGIVSIITGSKGMQWILMAVAICIVVKMVRREIVDAKCAVKSGAENMSNHINNSEFSRFGANAMETANRVMEKRLEMDARQKSNSDPKVRNLRKYA